MNRRHATSPQSRRKGDKQRGQGLVEFSLILPILLFVILGIVDYGRVLFVISNATNAVRDGSRNATLVGQADNGGTNTERYRACTTIEDDASNIFFGNVTHLHVLYFNTLRDTAADDFADTIAAANDYEEVIEGLVPSDTTTFSNGTEGADYDCDADGTIPNISTAGDIDTGDLMVVLMEVEIQFVTPFLSSAFPAVQFEFRGQRTVVTALQLRTSPTDRDGDGLNDAWENAFFGCLVRVGGTDYNPVDPRVGMQPDGTMYYADGDSVAWLNDGYTLGTTPLVEAPDRDSAKPGNYPADCARENLPVSTFYDGSGNLIEGSAFDFAFYECDFGNDMSGGLPFDSDADGQIENCIMPATSFFTSVSDPDQDGVSNAAEAARGTEPIDIDEVNGADSDGDGLSDLVEIGAGTNPLSGDSDGDGLGDGEELCGAVDSNGNSLDGPTCVTFCTSNACYGTNPTNPDTDADGLTDGREVNETSTEPRDSDTDNDGVIDGLEVDGFRIPLLVINGIPQGGLQFFLDPNDSDFDDDGLLDGEEVNGFEITNAINGTITVYTRPDRIDTDEDGACDGPADLNNGICEGTFTGPDGEERTAQDVNPTVSDTDGDGLSDGAEQLDFLTFADNINSDGDQCYNQNGVGPDGTTATFFSLTDGQELDSDLAVLRGVNNNPDGDALNNALDLNSDELAPTAPDAGLPDPDDCEEFYRYSINPYNEDTDGDGFTDVFELSRFCMQPTVPEPPGFDTTCGGQAGDDTDSDNDGIPDVYERSIFEPLGLTGADALDEAQQNAVLDDNDNCDLECEFLRRTDPADPDSDDDGIRDGYETGTDPNNVDTDGDGLGDGLESGVNAAAGVNPGEAVCLDPSNTGNYITPLLDANNNVQTNGSGEVIMTAPQPATSRVCYPADPQETDTDGDNLTDADEVAGVNFIINGVTRVCDTANGDVVSTTFVNDTDSDDDGRNDGAEVTGFDFDISVNGGTVRITDATNPCNPDTDADGLTDFTELGSSNATDPTNPDTDGDGLIDGSTAAQRGERDGVAGIDGYGTNPTLADSDGDTLSDWQEIFPDTELRDGGGNLIYAALNPYQIDLEEDGSLDTIPLAGYDYTQPFNRFRLNPLSNDSDGDGLTDGYEMTRNTAAGNDYFTNPTSTDTDGDGFSDFDEINSGGALGTNPIVTDSVDSDDPDGDGLTNTEELDPDCDTNPNDRDTDDDGILDNRECTDFTITYYAVRYDATTGSYESRVFTETIDLDGTNDTGSSPFGYVDGYDTDGDGLADSYELYYADPSQLDTTGGFVSWQGASGTCTYLENNTLSAPFIDGQPLDPTRPDTDGDGLYDRYECETGTNPFDATSEVALTSKITDNNLRQAVSFATGGDLITAVQFLETNPGVRTDGRVQLNVRRSELGLIGPAVATACGPAATPSGTIIPNVCGSLVTNTGILTTNETNGPGSSDDIVQIIIAPSAVLELIESAGVNLRAIAIGTPGTGNISPIASFSVNCTGPDGRVCEFDASGSTDGDGSIVSYSWVYDGAGTGPNTGVNPTYTYDADGTYTVELTVEDDGGAINTSTTQVVIGTGGVNTAPVASFTSNCTGLSCDFTDTSTDNGSITAWAWDFDNDGTVDSTSQNPSFTYSAANTYTVSLTVTDNGSPALTDNETNTVTVAPALTRVFVVNLEQNDSASNWNPNGNAWNAIIQIVVETENNTAASNVTVSGTFVSSDSSTFTGSCTTNASGFCEITQRLAENKDDWVDFTVDNITGTNVSYDSTQNSDSGGDPSDGTTIRANKP